MKQFIKLGLTDRHAGEGMPAMDGFVFPSNINDVTDGSRGHLATTQF